jgi:hypothetical protein
MKSMNISAVIVYGLPRDLVLGARSVDSGIQILRD